MRPIAQVPGTNRTFPDTQLLSLAIGDDHTVEGFSPLSSIAKQGSFLHGAARPERVVCAVCKPDPSLWKGNTMNTAEILPEPRLIQGRWNPYVVGAGLGVLSWAVFAIVNAPLGITTALSQVSGAVAEPVIGQEGLKANAYWAKNMPAWDYGTLFLVGTFIGALVSVLVSRSFRVESVPGVWRERFGPSTALRLVAAFAGGILTMFGARMAGGCTSGNGLSGSLQLAVSGWTFFIVMFISGVATAWLVFGRPSPRRTPDLISATGRKEQP